MVTLTFKRLGFDALIDQPHFVNCFAIYCVAHQLDIY